MGQQQLLILVLVIVLVGIAVAAGIYMVRVNAVESNRRALVTELTSLGTRAQAYYLKPANLGGGGHSFKGFFLSALDTSSANGSFRLSTSRPSGEEKVQGSTQPITSDADSIFIVGSGKEIGNDGTNPIKAYVKVTPAEIKAFLLN